MSVTVTIDDFDENEVLGAALEIIESHMKARGDVKLEGYLKRQRDTIAEYVEKFYTALTIRVKEADEANWPPPSTAAKIRTLAELREIVSKQTEH